MAHSNGKIKKSKSDLQQTTLKTERLPAVNTPQHLLPQQGKHPQMLSSHNKYKIKQQRANNEPRCIIVITKQNCINK